jgi:hypothetical protein
MNEHLIPMEQPSVNPSDKDRARIIKVRNEIDAMKREDALLTNMKVWSEYLQETAGLTYEETEAMSVEQLYLAYLINTEEV